MYCVDENQVESLRYKNDMLAYSQRPQVKLTKGGARDDMFAGEICMSGEYNCVIPIVKRKVDRFSDDS
jgi:hypothetical protein